MRKNLIPFLFIPFMLSGFVSCDSNDDDNEQAPTGIDGRPSVVEENGKRIFFYYDVNRISRIKEENGSVLNFKYGNDNTSSYLPELSSISISPANKDVADGRGDISFIRKGNKVTIERTGEPSFSIQVKELELDENMLPAKITDMGNYRLTTSGREKISDGEYYSLFSFDAATSSILKEEVYRISDGEKVATYTYKYEDTPGVLSKIDFPKWFNAYWNSRMAHLTGYRKLFFSHTVNLSEVVIDDSVNGVSETRRYTYEYNKNNYPVAMRSATHEIKKIGY